MASIISETPHVYSSVTNDLSFDETNASTRLNDNHSIETIPSPSQSRPGILSSTLKIKTKSDRSNMSLKHRLRYEKLLHHTRVFNRHYMITMTNILFHMHKQLYKLRRRTHRMEKMVNKQPQKARPIIRIPRLTEDQLSTICINNDATSIYQETTLSDDINHDLPIQQSTKIKPNKRLNKYKNSKNSIGLSKRVRPHIWINNRQRSIDPDRYCSICQYEYSKRSNFIIHVRNIHKGQFPPKINEQDQSLHEMNEENFHEQFQQEKQDTNNDRSVISTDNDIQPLQMVINQLNISEGKLRPRTNTESIQESLKRAKIKCDICHKFYRADYIKKHKRRAHSDQEVLSHSSEIDNHSNRPDSISEKSTDQIHSSIENPISINDSQALVAPTPMTIPIAENDIDDTPIQFRIETRKSIVIAVTCLEPCQLDLVEKFLKRFSSIASQSSCIDSHTTHLITNDEQTPLRSPLSMKLIEAIAHHCFCLSYRWIADCLQYDRIIDEESYEIEGDDTEVHPHGGPRRSRLIPNRHSLFENFCFMIKCMDKSDIRMTNDRLEELITTCGGKIITSVSQRLLEKYRIIILCDMSYVSERRQNYEQCRSLGIRFVSSDWVLESILEYRQKPFSLFEEAPL